MYVLNNAWTSLPHRKMRKLGIMPTNEENLGKSNTVPPSTRLPEFEIEQISISFFQEVWKVCRIKQNKNRQHACRRVAFFQWDLNFTYCHKMVPRFRQLQETSEIFSLAYLQFNLPNSYVAIRRFRTKPCAQPAIVYKQSAAPKNSLRRAPSE